MKREYIMTMEKITNVLEMIEIQEKARAQSYESVRNLEALLAKEVVNWLNDFAFDEIEWILYYDQHDGLRLTLPLDNKVISDLCKVMKMYYDQSYQRTFCFEYKGEKLSIWWSSFNLFILPEHGRDMTLAETFTIYTRLGFKYVLDKSFYQDIEIVRNRAKKKVVEFHDLDKLISLTAPEEKT